LFIIRLRNNKLTLLPFGIGILKQLSVINLGGNPSSVKELRKYLPLNLILVKEDEGFY